MSTKKPSPKIKNIQKTDPAHPEEEKGGFKDQGLKEPTRFGDWEVNGRCSDF